MDFELRHTEEQERFRQEVRSWLDANLPEAVQRSGELDRALWEQCKAFQQALGDRGWLAPTDPVAWGGGGLTQDHATVLREEMEQRGLAWLLEQGASALRSALQQWGSEEQKQRYLPVVARGQATLWHLSVEPGAELDVGNLGVQASRDGDDYILNGGDTFVGQGLWPDYLWTLAVTDPDAPPDESTGTFLVPAGLQRIRIHTPRALVPGETHQVTFDNVRVPPSCLLGDEAEGWSLMQATLLQQPTLDHPPSHDQSVTDLLQYARETARNGAILSKEPFLQQLLVESYITSQVTRLFRTRNAWMAHTGQELTYHLPQTALWEEQAALRLSQIVREVMGVYAFLDHQDPRSPFKGKFERHQRQSLARQNPAGGPETQADAVAAQLNLGLNYRKGRRRKSTSSSTPTGATKTGGV